MKESLKALFTAVIVLYGLAPSCSLLAYNNTADPTVSEKPAKSETTVSYDDPKDSLMRSGYALETDEQSASESLERVSGKIDMGYSPPENSFKSPDQYAPGPFAKEKAEELRRASETE